MTKVNFNNVRAFSEGWVLFSDGVIQRLNEPSASGFHASDVPVFENDEAAIAFVRGQAEAGSPYHKAAIKLALL